jgi:hypothetical protein
MYAAFPGINKTKAKKKTWSTMKYQPIVTITQSHVANKLFNRLLISSLTEFDVLPPTPFSILESALPQLSLALTCLQKKDEFMSGRLNKEQLVQSI